MVAVLGFEPSQYLIWGFADYKSAHAPYISRPDLAVGVGLEPTSSRVTIERWTSSATLQKNGWPGEIRTRYLTIKNRLLIRMSFRPVVAMAGFEPAITRLKGGRLKPLVHIAAIILAERTRIELASTR